MRGRLKTNLIIACLLFAGVAVSYGQGQIVWQNSTSSEVTFPGGWGGQWTGLGGQNLWGPAGTFEYGLYLGPAGSNDISKMTLVDTYLNAASTSSTSPAAGQIRGGVLNGVGNTGVAIGTSTYADVVAVWLAADGSSYAAALNSSDPNPIIGLSAIGSITPVALPGVPAQVFGTGVGQIGGFSAFPPIPEPSTIALGGLGAAALLLFRRRKK